MARPSLTTGSGQVSTSQAANHPSVPRGTILLVGVCGDHLLRFVYSHTASRSRKIMPSRLASRHDRKLARHYGREPAVAEHMIRWATIGGMLIACPAGCLAVGKACIRTNGVDDKSARYRHHEAKKRDPAGHPPTLPGSAADLLVTDGLPMATTRTGASLAGGPGDREPVGGSEAGQGAVEFLSPGRRGTPSRTSSGRPRSASARGRRCRGVPATPGWPGQGSSTAAPSIRSAARSARASAARAIG
jgi:hypothetical protein